MNILWKEKKTYNTMMKLEDLKRGATVKGVLPDQLVARSLRKNQTAPRSAKTNGRRWFSVNYNKTWEDWIAEALEVSFCGAKMSPQKKVT